MNGERIPLTKKKEKIKKEDVTIVEHENLTDEERKALYKFFKYHPEELFGKRKRKSSKKSKRCICK